MATEKRLIELDVAKKLFDDIPPFIGMTGKCVQDMLDTAPAVDAVEVVHGRWEWDTEDVYKCSNCAEKSHVLIGSSAPTAARRWMVMGMRKKLFELLTHENSPLFMVFGDNVEGLVDYLIANGVTIPVRCKDCTSYHSYGSNLDGGLVSWGKCMKIDMDVDMPANGYCCYGERRPDVN